MNESATFDDNDENLENTGVYELTKQKYNLF